MHLRTGIAFQVLREGLTRVVILEAVYQARIRMGLSELDHPLQPSCSNHDVVVQQAEVRGDGSKQALVDSFDVSPILLVPN
jgi:hypothetical protein